MEPTMHQDLQLGPSWVLTVRLKLFEKRLIFTSKQTSTWCRGVKDTLLNPFATI